MRKTFSIIAIVVLLLSALAAAGVWKYQQILSSLNLHQFDFQLKDLGWRHARFERVSFVYPTDSSEEHIKLTDVELNWLWRSWFAPELVSVKLNRAQLDHRLLNDPKNTPEQEPFVLPDQWQIPDFLPQQIYIEQLLVLLPCPAGACAFAGSVETKRVDDSLVLVAHISPDKALDSLKHIAIIARYKVQQNLPWLQFGISAEDKIKVELETYLVDEEERYWAGKISGVAHYPNEWLLHALQEWNIVVSNNWTQSLNQPIKMNSDWRLALAPLMSENLAWSNAVNGALSLDAVVDSPILIKELGEFSGNVKINLKAAEGKLELFHLNGAVDVHQVVMPEALQAQGFNVSDVSITADSEVDAELDTSRVPVTISVKTLGAIQSDMTTNLLLDINNKNVLVEKIQLKASAEKIAPTDTIQLTNMVMNLTAQGHWQDNEIAVRVLAPSEIKTDLNASALTLTAKALEFKTAKFNLAGKLTDGKFDWPTWIIDTRAELSAAQLEHPQLKKNPWHWSGDVKGSLSDAKVNGALTVNRALNVKHDIHYRAPQLVAEWQLGDVFLLAGNPFADVLNAWPPLLSFLQGRINANGDLKFNTEKNSFTSNAVINLKDVSGIYDTTAFQGLTSSVKLVAQEKSMQLKTDEILVNQVNKGITMGPLLAAGSYTVNNGAASQGFTQGTLVLDSFKGKVMGGTISVPGQTFDLSHEQQDFTLTLTDIDLGLLLKQHPTNELSGSGKISGGIPIRISTQGIMVNKGIVSALPPGGELKFQSTKADAIAKKQPSVKVITDALNDFHYSVLASEVNYDESGKLLLSVKLEGRNPQLENGRPIHFSINLEENIPAMIASLQLSNQISDVIKKRIQEKLTDKNLQNKPEQK